MRSLPGRGQMKKSIIMLLICCTTSLNAAENSTDLNYGMGILNIRSQSIAQSFRLTLPLMVPGDIKPGYQVTSQTTWSNIWAEEKSYLLDYESLDTTLGIAYGFNKKLGMALMVDSRTYFGGEMDGFIQGFHDLLNIGQNGRDNYANNRSVITRYDPETGLIIDQQRADQLNNSGINLLVNYNLEHHSRVLPGINIYGVARYPLNTAEFIGNKKGMDLGIGLGLSKKLASDFYTYAIAGYTRYNDRGNRHNTNIELTNHQFTGLFAMGYTLSDNLALIAQYLYSTAVIKGIDGLDKASHELHLGVNFKVGKKAILGVSLIENIITMDNSPDFGIHVGLNLQL
jgi:hypothetical protein